MAAENENWIELADLIDQQMAQLGWSQADLARESGVNAHTVRALQRHERTSYRANTLRAVSRALGWGPMAIEVFIGGGDAPRTVGVSVRKSPADAGNVDQGDDLDSLALASGIDPRSLSAGEKEALQVVFDGIRARRGTR